MHRDPMSLVRQADLDEIRTVIQMIQHELETPPVRIKHTPIANRKSHAATAKSLYDARRARAKVFGENADIFYEPAWDMLLDLYLQRAEGRTVSVTSACIAAAVPATTALRWLSTLETRGLLERTQDSFDRRRCYVQLSAMGVEAMERYFDLVA